jgi:hypothetical protein
LNPRKGHWKVIDATTVELDVGNIRRHEKVTVSQGATLLTWAPREADELHPQVAIKIVPPMRTQTSEPPAGQ